MTIYLLFYFQHDLAFLVFEMQIALVHAACLVV
jgi:hypothetical protein